MGNLRSILFVPLAALVLHACAVPRFDVAHEGGRPTIRHIVQQIVCELAEMVKHDDAGKLGFETFLVEGNYVAALNLELSVTETGELAPSFSFPAVADNLAIRAGLNLSNSATRTFERRMHFSFAELRHRLDANPEFGACPSEAGVNLAGELGIAELVYLQFTARSTPTADTVGGDKEFGGTIAFTVKRNVNSAGPTWTLSRFVGPGGLVTVERESTNKLTIAFDRVAKPAGTPKKPGKADFDAADAFLFQLLVSDRLAE